MAIRVHRRKVFCGLVLQRGAARGRLRLEQLVGLAEQRFHLHRRWLDRQTLAAFEPRHVEEILDQTPHSLRGEIDDVELLAIFSGGAPRRLEQRRGEGDGIEGIAKIVRDDGQHLFPRSQRLL